MKGNKFIFVCGVIFYLFVTLNYPFLDLIVSQAKASLLFYNPDNSKNDDLFLSYTIKTHKWNIPSSKPSSNNKTNQTKSIHEESVVIYVVKEGDVLWKIAQKYGVGISAICKLNNLKTTTLTVGKKLKIKCLTNKG